MSLEQQLKELVAELLDLSSTKISPSFSLDVPKFRSSVGRMILKTTIMDRFAKDIDIARIQSFADLLTQVTGENVSDEAPQTGSATDPENPKTDQAPSAMVFSGKFSCGVDMEQVSALPETNDFWTHEFYREQFTPEEIAYCVSQSLPRIHFAARWCAKEALKKCAPQYMQKTFSQIQILKHPDGSVSLQVLESQRWQDLSGSVSLSHTNDHVIAVVIVSAESYSAASPTAQKESPPASPTPTMEATDPSPPSVQKKSFWKRLLSRRNHHEDAI